MAAAVGVEKEARTAGVDSEAVSTVEAGARAAGRAEVVKVVGRAAAVGMADLVVAEEPQAVGLGVAASLGLEG